MTAASFDLRAPPAVILAGGLSRRMGGGDKALCLLQGRPMLAHVIDALRPQARPLAVNANGDPARFARFGLPVLPDPLPGHPGPLAGVLAALDWAAGLGADRVLTVPADTPFLPADLAAKLTKAGAPAVAAAEGRLHPVIGLWPVALAPDLRDTLAAGQRKMGDFARRHGAAPVPLPPEALTNVNTPEDLSQAMARCP